MTRCGAALRILSAPLSNISPACRTSPCQHFQSPAFTRLLDQCSMHARPRSIIRICWAGWRRCSPLAPPRTESVSPLTTPLHPHVSPVSSVPDLGTVYPPRKKMSVNTGAAPEYPPRHPPVSPVSSSTVNRHSRGGSVAEGGRSSSARAAATPAWAARTCGSPVNVPVSRHISAGDQYPRWLQARSVPGLPMPHALLTVVIGMVSLHCIVHTFP